MTRRVVRFPILALLAIGIWLGSFSTLKGQTLQIDSLKANYIQGFMDFVRWEGQIRSEHATIGVLGSQELVDHLQKLAEEKTDGRSIHIVKVDTEAELEGLNVLFVGSGKRERWRDLVEKCKRHNTLLIGEEDGFIEAGGCIQFVLRRNRLRFIVNTENANLKGIELSSKLVELSAE